MVDNIMGNIFVNAPGVRHGSAMSLATPQSGSIDFEKNYGCINPTNGKPKMYMPVKVFLQYALWLL